MSAPTQIAHYRITGKLGEGGMGAVYRAVDEKLNREVAIKVLPPALAHDADYIARFQREAQTLAALNHPHIATIYGIEANAIVMELVEGSTLKGPMPLDEVLPIARQIAEALEAAHDKGIIHRDLKPGNIKLTPEGVVKVLDFGLAKAVNERPVVTGPDSPTLTMRATEAGLILGTAGYMSPEQAAGKTVDRRADIWSFGVVLYELLTGRRLFDGETVSHTLAHVLTREIDLTGVPLSELIARCLDRKLKNRLAHISEARIAIENYSPKPEPKAVAKSNYWPWAAAAIGFLIGAAGWVTRPSPQPSAAIAFEVNPPPGIRFAPIGARGGSAISPDGKMLAFFGANLKQEDLLYVRPIDSIEARALPGTQGAGRPFWSPDSKSIGFVGEGKLKRIDIAGGPPVTLCDAGSAPRGGAWSPEGVILFGQLGKAIQRIAASGGTPVAVTGSQSFDENESHYYPQFLPGGKRFLFLNLNRTSPEKSGIYLATLDGQAPVRLVNSGHNAAHDASSQRLFYLQGTGTLMARRSNFDPPALTGDPVVVAEEIRTATMNGYAEFSLSASGDLFYGRGREASLVRGRLGWRDRSGKLLEQVGPVESLPNGFLSPDGSRFVQSRLSNGVDPDVWVFDLVRGLSTRVTFSGGSSPAWSPDGKQIYYWNRSGIHRRAADGSGEDELLWKRPALPSQFSTLSPTRDGGSLLVPAGKVHWRLPLTGERTPTEYRNMSHPEFWHAFSPDGRWLAYSSAESGRSEIYVRGFPEERGKWQISSESGSSPRWRGDGKELFWWAPTDQGVVAARVEPQASAVRAGRPEKLFSLPGSYFVGPSPDGRRFLFVEPEAAEAAKDYPMVVIRNLTARFK